MRSPSGCRTASGIVMPLGARFAALRPQPDGCAIVSTGTNCGLECVTNPDMITTRRHASRRSTGGGRIGNYSDQHDPRESWGVVDVHRIKVDMMRICRLA